MKKLFLGLLGLVLVSGCTVARSSGMIYTKELNKDTSFTYTKEGKKCSYIFLVGDFSVSSIVKKKNITEVVDIVYSGSPFHYCVKVRGN
ncbi:MAG: hypothetical protein LBQ13_01300 [Endomicrobium sp.]|jgi:hypothetical protein|nr:hypothetical protein [Endomicrobium sp.]